MNNSIYELEGESYISHFFLTLTATIILTVILTYFSYFAGLEYEATKYVCGFICFSVFIYSQIQWVYHNVGRSGRYVMIAALAIAGFCWVYYVGQALGGH